jgi:hypothetical protein
MIFTVPLLTKRYLLKIALMSSANDWTNCAMARIALAG